MATAIRGMNIRVPAISRPLLIRRPLLRALLFAACGLLACSAWAAGQTSTSATDPNQQAFTASSLAAKPSRAEAAASRADIFAGYSYLYPFSKLNGTSYNSLNQGMIFSAAYFFTHHLGLQAEGSYHFQTVNDGFYTLGAGPIFRLPFANGLTPFAHLLGGESQVTGPNIPTIGTSTFFFNPGTWGPSATGGLGLDDNLPFFNHRFALRIVQADYQYMRPDFGPVRPTTGGVANIEALRASSGLVLHLGSFEPPAMLGLTCSASPSSLYAGDQVMVSAAPTDADPKKPMTYTWAASGGKVVGQNTANSSSITLDTTGLAPASYTVTGHASQGSRTGESADCMATFTVNQFQPTTVSCSANPSTVNQGDMATVTAQGYSPQNRPLTYSYAASGGSILGTGSTATLGTQGAPPGRITVTCNVVDDKGQTAASTADVLVQQVAQKPVPTTQDLCSILFVRDAKRPARVDNEAKACLDAVALDLQRNPDAKAVLIGNNIDSEPGGVSIAAQRAVNTKAYLVTEKGIDAARVLVRTGTANAKMVSNYLLPAGADFDHDMPGTAIVNPAVAPQVRKPLAYRQPAPKRRSASGPAPK